MSNSKQELDPARYELALRGVATPLAVSTYTTDRALPAELRAELPTRDQFAAMIRDTRRGSGRRHGRALSP